MAGYHELELAAQELENFNAAPPGAEGETGRGAATALLQLLHTVENTNGLVTPEQQQAALRVGLAQLDAAGRPLRNVAIPGVIRRGVLNKPDVSYLYQDPAPRGVSTLRRMNVEIDTNPGESRRHQAIVNGRDPNARNLYVVVHPWTGQIVSAQVREPGARRMRAVPGSGLAGLFQTLPRTTAPVAQPRARNAGRRTSSRLREFELPLERELAAAATELESTAGW
jgi:hypothetical protein